MWNEYQPKVIGQLASDQLVCSYIILPQLASQLNSSFFTYNLTMHIELWELASQQKVAIVPCFVVIATYHIHSQLTSQVPIVRTQLASYTHSTIYLTVSQLCVPLFSDMFETIQYSYTQTIQPDIFLQELCSQPASYIRKFLLARLQLTVTQLYT